MISALHEFNLVVVMAFLLPDIEFKGISGIS
jgi:hypothetical protein